MTAPLRLFRLISLRHIARRRMRYFLAALSVVLAVMLFVSMRVTQVSVLRSFERTVQALSGRAEVMVTTGIGIEPEALAKIEAVGGLRAAPVIQESTLAPDLNAPVMVLGIDYIRDAKLRRYAFRDKLEADPAGLMLDPKSVMIARSFAERHGLKPGSRLRLETQQGRQEFRVAGILNDEGPARALSGQIVIMSVAAAQTHFGRKGRYDRIEVAFDGTTAEQLRAGLGPGYHVSPLPKTNPMLEQLLAQHRTALLGVTVIAILIGVFIIYNSLSLSMVERTKEIGILRALGARRREIVAALTLEAGFMGLLASAAGAALGVAISRGMIDQAARHINLLMYVVDVREVTVPADALLLAGLAGIGTAVAGALFPALAASRVPPLMALRPAAYRIALSRRYARWFTAGALIFGTAAFLALHPRLNRDAVVASLVCAFSGLALMLPQIILWASGLLRVLGRHVLNIEAYLAMDNIVKFPSRTSLTVIAFAGSLSILVSMWGVSAAFQKSINDWLQTIFPFDLAIQLQDLSAGAYSTATFPEPVLQEVRSDPRVDRVYGIRVSLVPYRDTTVMIVAIDVRTFMDLRFERGMVADRAYADRISRRMEAGEVLLSTNFANLHGVREGGVVELLSARGPQRFRVLEVVEDFSWPRGVVFMDRAVYRQLWQDDALTYVDLRARPDTDVAGLKRDLARRFHGRYNVFVYETGEVKAHSIKLVREWFRLADVPIFIAVIIGAIGVVNTLLISLMTQTRQIALLRAVGASTGQINASLAIEAVYIGLISGVLGCAMGLFVVKFPMARMALNESGYAIPFVFPSAAVALALGAGLAIALLASTIPIRFTRRINLIDAIGYE